MPNLYDDLGMQFELFLDSMQKNIELCSSLEQCKKKKCKPNWVRNKDKNDISRKKQALKRYGEITSASNETSLQRIVKRQVLLANKPNVIIFQMSFQIV